MIVVGVAGTAIIPVAITEAQACTGLVGATISIGHTITKVVAIVPNATQISGAGEFLATSGVTVTFDGSRIADGSSAVSASCASAVLIIVVRCSCFVGHVAGAIVRIDVAIVEVAIRVVVTIVVEVRVQVSVAGIGHYDNSISAHVAIAVVAATASILVAVTEAPVGTGLVRVASATVRITAQAVALISNIWFSILSGNNSTLSLAFSNCSIIVVVPVPRFS